MESTKKADVGVVAFQFYEGNSADKYMGVAQVDLPDLTFLTQTVSGAGIAGNMEVALLGQMDTMEVTVSMKTQTKHTVVLARPVQQRWELREVQGYIGSSSALQTTGVRHVMQVIPKSMTGGSIQANSPSNPTVVGSVYSWRMYGRNLTTKKEEEIMYICPAEYICRINGVNYLKGVSSFLK